MATKTSFVSMSSNSTWTNFLGWTGSGVSSGLTTLGFLPVTDSYSANGGSTSWANGTTNSTLSNPNVIPTGTSSVSGLFGSAFPTNSNNARAALAATQFQGSWSSIVAYTVGQVVKYTPAGGAQQTYMCWATGGVGISPAGVATSINFWTPYWFEIWTTNSGSLTNFYFKIEYGGNNAGITRPEITIQIGTAASGAGVISASGNFSLCEQVIDPTLTGTTNLITYMSGDGANYFAILTWAGGTSQNSALCGFERSISGTVSAAPVYTSTYVTYCVNANLNTGVHQNSVFLSGSATSGTGFNGTAVRITGVATISMTATPQSMQVNSVSPALPIFPLVGWVGNPMTIFIGLSNTDASEGASITTTVYGATHTYLCTVINSFDAFATGLGSVSSYGVGMRYE